MSEKEIQEGINDVVEQLLVGMRYGFTLKVLFDMREVKSMEKFNETFEAEITGIRYLARSIATEYLKKKKKADAEKKLPKMKKDEKSLG